MVRPMDDLVSVVRFRGNIEETVKESLTLIDGIKSIVNRGDKVYLKPNFVAPRKAITGVTTDLEIVRVVAEEIKACGATPIIFETPANEFDQAVVYEVLGIREFAKRNHIELEEGTINWIDIKVPGGKVLKSLKVPDFVPGAKIINLPKLKTHISAKMTCGMKNLFGLISHHDKKRAHAYGVNEAIADICKVIKPILTIVDGIVVMEGDGPTYGDRIELGLIVAGKNLIAVDRVCCKVIGIPEEEVRYIRIFSSDGFKEYPKVVGDLPHISLKLRIPQKSTAFHFLTRSMYTVDTLYTKLSSVPLNKVLYSTGYFGTNPKILAQKCDKCGQCLDVCPVSEVVDLTTLKINYKKCVRCLECYTACDRGAIFIKGFSRPEK
jgi:uncharacterized protein (DUF362 family)/ferredoxin